ncbi:MAG: response regulator [Flavobacteriia bacterium]|nr:response regulator [Flavobacteriia bacterium]
MGHILIADDHVFLLKAISILLSKEGYTFETAINGQEAIDLFDKGGFDAVITDIDMPIKNGMELIAHIRSHSTQPSTPIIVLSSLYKEEDNSIKEIELAGASTYISKMDSPLGIVGALQSLVPYKAS